MDYISIISNSILSYFISNYFQIDFPEELSKIILSFISVCTEEDEYMQDVMHCIQLEQDEYLQYEDAYIFEQQQYQQILLHDNDFCEITSNCSQCAINQWQVWNMFCNV